MKIVQKDFTVHTKNRTEMIDITDRIESIIRDSGVANGVVTVYCPHTTAAITINENADRSVVHDILLSLDELVPRLRPAYRHSEGNSDAHCKSSIIGCSRDVLVKDASLVLGTWQGIFFCEFDGPRTRTVIVQTRGL